MGRRGQVTLWVLLGVALLILFILLLVLLRRPDALPRAEVLPDEFTPLQEHVIDCVESVGLDALKLLAMHGGYIDPTSQRYTDRALTLDPLSPTESELLLANPADNGSGVPYYYHLAGPNDCAFCTLTTLTPTVESMTAQVERYVEEEMRECLNFGGYPDVQVVVDDDQEASVDFFEESVFINYERTIDFTRGGQRVRARTFPATIDVPFLRYYETAKAITQKEIDTQFLENYLQYLQSAYSGLDADLPPIAGYEEGHVGRQWVLYAVQERFRQLLYRTTPALQVLGTRGVTPPPPVDDPWLAGFLRMTYLDLIDDPALGAERFRVSIYYPNSPIHLDVRPREGQLITPRRERVPGFFIVPSRTQHYYDFAYDISAPFLFEIRHENATAQTDFSFLFALEANIRENKNVLEWLLGRGTIPWSHDFVQFDVTDPASSDPSYQDLADRQRYTHNRSLQTLFCSPSQAVVPLAVQTFDGATNRPLPDVEFSYSCGYYETCDLGYSTYDEQDVYARLDTLAPICVGGTLRAEKAGYNPISVPVSTRQEGLPVTASPMTLDPFKQVDVRIEKYQVEVQLSPFTDDEVFFLPPNPVAEPLDGDETVIVTLTLHQTGGDEPVSSTAIFSNMSRNITTLTLVPGLYELRAEYIDNEGFTIPGCHEAPVCLHPCDTNPPDEDVVVEPAPLGGLLLTDETWYFPVERSDLYTKETLVIPVFVAPTPECLEQLDRMGHQEKYTRQFFQYAEPYWE